MFAIVFINGGFLIIYILNERRMEGISIVNSQNVKLEMVRASVAERLVAALIDYIILLSLVFILINIFREDLTLFAILCIPLAFYALLMEIFWRGQSIGKYIFKIKVVKEDGGVPSIFDFLIRWVFRLIDISSTMGGLATLVIAFSAKGQRLGDIAASTIVIKLNPPTSISGNHYEKLEEHEVVFHEVVKLSEADIELIEKVLQFYSKSDYGSKAMNYVVDATVYIHKKMGVGFPKSALQFLHTVLKDTYSLRGKE
jgi:Predicted membrane protein/domain